MQIDIRKLNSITKYPSILTYHAMGDKGRLKSELSEDKSFSLSDELYVYEKVDGENSRVVFLNDKSGTDYFIGSREEILASKGDRVYNPYGSIADLLIPVADKLKDNIFYNQEDIALTVIYQESYGGKTKKSKEYTSTGDQAYRVFDAFSLTWAEYHRLMSMDVREIASWRDKGGQSFYNETEKERMINNLNLPFAPRLATISGQVFPIGHESVYDYLLDFEKTEVGIDVQGRSEGIMVRNADRSMIRKIRFEDYEKTLGIKRK